MAAAVVSATQFVQCRLAIFRIASSHGRVDQLRDVAAVVVAAITGLAAGIASTTIP